jgi:hypothetical protein
MSFSLTLTQDLVSVEPGASAPISAAVQNLGEGRERFELEIEGVDPEWKAVPVPVFDVDGAQTRTERMFFKPPRASESAAGDYPFVVRVRSLESGETHMAQGVLQVRPFHHLSMEVAPKRGIVSPSHRSHTFEVTLVNLGNTEHNVRLLASDPEDECAYEVASEQVALGPGAQKQVDVVASPKRSPWFTSGRLIGATFSARSVDVPSVVVTSQAQVEQRPLLSVATLAVILLAGILFGAWLFVRPRPAVLEAWSDPVSVQAGQSITVHWQMKEADHILVKTKNETIHEGAETTGSADYKPSTEGQLTIDVVASRDGNEVKHKTISVNVVPAPEVDPPTIDLLRPESTPVPMGESFVLEYKFGKSVTKATLGPDNVDLNLQLDKMTFKPTHVGVNDYTVVAVNSKGEEVHKPFRVNVFEASDAHILTFVSFPKVATQDNPRVTLNWQVTGSARVELKINGDTPFVVDPTAQKDFVVTAKTSFTLTAIDANGRKVTSTVVVPFTAPKMPILPNTSGSDGTPPITDPNKPDQPAPTTSGQPTTTTSTTSGGVR